MGLAIAPSSAPGAEPLTTAEAKTHLRVDTADDDTYIGALILAARQQAESITRRALITQTWKYYLAQFPINTPGQFPNAIELPLAPLQTVTSIKYTDNDGAEQTVDSGDYDVDINIEPGRIIPSFGNVWPSTRYQANSVVVEYKTGYGNASTDIPAQLIHAIKLLIGHWYENRESVVTGTQVNEVPDTVQYLLDRYIIRS
jgi:uncharacterized phiE125 gp8 family phage protein